MEDIIRKYLCNLCLNKNEQCMKYTEEKVNGVKKYKCEDYIFNGERRPYDIFTYRIRSNGKK